MLGKLQQRECAGPDQGLEPAELPPCGYLKGTMKTRERQWFTLSPVLGQEPQVGEHWVDRPKATQQS